jgi:hypothetical protein
VRAMIPGEATRGEANHHRLIKFFGSLSKTKNVE